MKLTAALAGTAGVSYRWQWQAENSASVASGPYTGPGEEEWTNNQTVFLRGYKVIVRPPPVASLQGSVKVSPISAANPGRLLRKSSHVPFSRASSWKGWLFGDRKANGGKGSRDNSELQISPDIKSIPTASEPYHLSSVINTYLLNTVVCVTHDDVWISVLRNEESTFPDDKELLRRVLQKFPVSKIHGGAFIEVLENWNAPTPLVHNSLPNPRSPLGPLRKVRLPKWSKDKLKERQDTPHKDSSLVQRYWAKEDLFDVSGDHDRDDGASLTSYNERYTFINIDDLSNLTESRSTNSISLLPSVPPIFYGRDREVEDILRTLRTSQPARLAILGTLGVGKTSLARMVLHHSEVAHSFVRYFVSLDSCASATDMISMIANHIGFKPAPPKSLLKSIITYFSSESQQSLLVLDNLESCWESISERRQVEDFLSALDDIQCLSIMITMRGAERPARVRWTPPMIQPLQPLDYSDARKIFLDIVDHTWLPHEEADLVELLAFTGNLPLAVNLLAHVADVEGGSDLLCRLKKEGTEHLIIPHKPTY
ncbi:P-loop containing nucleoside triphosphate hydrolase protein [Mycena metata]|uniref:P-loop containing nucleoside triphosphate hydrolase protein n=1 Tax=Mycena metata TaxID=1033252 RepID=A0AAD7NLR5_9AGAR|nr:P-loop containing nucleoside triphosphate hydrolase protein [Mycena metata]